MATEGSRPWSTMVDHGRQRSTRVDHGRPWSTVVDQGRPGSGCRKTRPARNWLPGIECGPAVLRRASSSTREGSIHVAQVSAWGAGTKALGSSSDRGQRQYGGCPSLAVEVCQLALRHRRGVSRGGLSCGRVRLALATVLCTGLLSGAVAAHSVSWGGSGGTLWSVRWEHRVLTAVGDTKKKPWSTLVDLWRSTSRLARRCADWARLVAAPALQAQCPNGAPHECTCVDCVPVSLCMCVCVRPLGRHRRWSFQHHCAWRLAFA